MSEITPVRSPEIIAAEINSIKAQTQQIMLQASIEIGRRLAEAKAAVGHGNWTKWLKQSVDYSERTATNLMRIFNEYGNGQEKLFGQSNQQAFAELSYTQAIALLGIHDEDDRAEFIKENDVDSMSTRELQEAIKERDKEKAENEKLSKALEAEKTAKKTAENTAFDLLAEKEKESKRAEELEKQLAEAKPADKEKMKQLKKDLAEQKAKVKELNDRLAEPIEAAIVEKVPEATELELKALREQAGKLQAATGQEKAVLEFKTYFDIVQNDAEKLLGAIDKIENEEMKTKCRAAAGKVLDMIRGQVGEAKS